jgi:hypothetical protein
LSELHADSGPGAVLDRSTAIEDSPDGADVGSTIL